MTDKNQQKNNLKLKPLGFLAISMSVALLTLLILDHNKTGKDFKPTASVAGIDSNHKRKARGKKEFVESVVIATEEGKNEPSLSEVSEKKSVGPEIKSSTSQALTEELDKQLESAQDLVDTGDINNIMKAKELLEKILAEDPNHDGSIKELAMIYLYDLDEPAKAQEFLQRSYSINPEDPLVFSETLQLASENGMVSQFLSQVREKLEKDSENATLNTQVAKVYAKSGDFLTAAEYHVKAAYASNSSEEAYQAALQYKKAGQKDLARQHIELSKQMITSNPNLSESQKKTQIEILDGQMERF
jgi:Tfp pilus assembly protein PilF